ncbi:MAG TPA: hypothetical protein VJN93_17845 [Candidatus Acidoferrum sp.]|nr:hypothetical protein [Candidatus Acidoferrum sp.]
MGQSSKRKLAAVRMLERVMKYISPISDISSVAAGSEASNFDRSLRKLKRLAKDDPDLIFWDILQRTVVKILKHVTSRMR